ELMFKIARDVPLNLFDPAGDRQRPIAGDHHVIGGQSAPRHVSHPLIAVPLADFGSWLQFGDNAAVLRRRSIVLPRHLKQITATKLEATHGTAAEQILNGWLRS